MKRLEIEWRHLDKEGRTCERCADTGEEVRSACETLAAELQPGGWEVVLKETLLTGDKISQSNSILINGIPIEELLPNARKGENCCVSCGELIGGTIMCRTIERGGRTFERIPASLIRKAAYHLIHQQSI